MASASGHADTAAQPIAASNKDVESITHAGGIEQEEEIRYADIGVNLTDSTYSGIYHGKQAHEPDLEDVIQRASEAGCRALMITGSDLEESRKAVALARKYPRTCRATIGIHPCSSKIFSSHPDGTSGVLAALTTLIKDASASTASTNSSSPTPVPLAAIGELGLDYDRLPLSPKETQLHAFRSQLTHLTTSLYPNSQTTPSPPLFLHSRAAHQDFIALLREFQHKLPRRGVVHSFTGSVAEMQELLHEGWDIGINGCSVRTEEGLEVVRALPLERMHLETDSPWCEIRQSSAGAQLLVKMNMERQGKAEERGADEANRKGGVEGGQRELAEGYRSVKKEKWAKGCLVKGRNEPCRIGEVAGIVGAVRGVDVRVVREAAWGNWVRMFGGGVGGGS